MCDLPKNGNVPRKGEFLSGLAFLQDGLDCLHWPIFAGSNHVHLGIAIYEHVRADLVVGRHDSQISLGLPAEREVEVAREGLPA
jgi:hypothetical protein